MSRFLERAGIRRKTIEAPEVTNGYKEGKEKVDGVKGKELLEFLAAELRYRTNDTVAYVHERSPEENPWDYEVNLRWDVRPTDKYAFSDSESKRVSIMGGYKGWGASGNIDIYYYPPREGEPNQDNPVNVDTDLSQQEDLLPKPLAEYTLEDKVRYAMTRTSHTIDIVAGTFNKKLWNKVTRMI